MHIRTATIKDLEPIKTLYEQVARKGGGLARAEDEISSDYVLHFLEKSIASGLIIVAENPEREGELIGEVHAYKAGIQAFDHVLTDLTIAVHPAYQGKKIGRTIFTIFLEEIGLNRRDIGRVELIARESNTKAIEFYQSLGFRIEGRLEMRIRTTDGQY